MKQKLINFLLKKGRIAILPIETSFYKSLFFEQPVKMDKEAVLLNYSEGSPFADPNVVYKMEDKNLYIWFYKESVETTALIPESYLVFDYFKNEDAIIMIEGNPKKIVIVKGGKLLSQSVKRDIDERYLTLLKKEYGVSKEIIIKEDEYERVLQEALYELSLNDFAKFADLKIDKDFYAGILERVALPSLVLVFALIAFEYGEYFYIKANINSKTKEYREIKRKNDQIRSEINDLENEAQKFIRFAKNNSDGFYKTKLLSFAMDVTKENNSTMIYSQFAGEKVIIVVKTPNPNRILNDLLKSNYFKELRIAFSKKERDGNETTRMEGKLNAK